LKNPQDRTCLIQAEMEQRVRFFALALNQIPLQEGAGIDADHLIEAILGIDDQYGVFVGPMRVLHHHHRTEWPQIVDRVLDSGNWELMYACSLVMADAYHASPNPSALADIMALAGSERLARHELGLYVLKVISAHGEGGGLDPEFLAPFLLDASFTRRALLGELLITLALRSVDVIAVVESGRLWDSPWPYHQTQVEDIVATQCLTQKLEASRFAGHPGVLRALRELEETEALRRDLITSRAVDGEENLRQLVAGYYELPTKLEAVRDAQSALGRSPATPQIARLLFAHPSWEVREAAGVALGNLWNFRKDLEGFLRSCVQDPNWRVRYATLEAAHALIGADGGRLFEEVLHRHALDSNSWVRGLCAGYLGSWIARCEANSRRDRLARFQNEIRTLVCDSDFWPLMDMQWYLRALTTTDVDIMPFVDAARSGLLGRIQGWLTMSREDIHHALDGAVRQEIR